MTAQPATIRVHTSTGAYFIPMITATLTDAGSGTGLAGQTVTFTATAATGQVITIGSALTDANGTATLIDAVVPAILVTAPRYTASFAGTAELAPASASASLTFDPQVKDETATSLTSSPNPSVVGGTITFTATVVAVPPVSGTPTGTVRFDITGPVTTSLNGTLNAGGVATVSTSTLPAGSYQVVARYQGNTQFNPSTSNTVTQVVNPAGPAPTAMTAAPAVIRINTTNGTYYIPELRATLTDPATGTGIAGQTISFTANPPTGQLNLGTAVTNANGVAVRTNVTVPAIITATNRYTASFAGTPTLAPATATASLTLAR